MRRGAAILTIAIAVSSLRCALLVDTSGFSGASRDAASDVSLADAGAETSATDAASDAPSDAGAGDASSDGRVLPPGTVVWSENGHGYLVVVQLVIWSQAKVLAADLGGHLVTLGSESENLFVSSLAESVSGAWVSRDGPWIGAYQPPGSSEPNGGWTWVTGEPVVYSSWSSGEPNDLGTENVGVYKSGSSAPRAPTWNDALESYEAPSFVVEFE